MQLNASCALLWAVSAATSVTCLRPTVRRISIQLAWWLSQAPVPASRRLFSLRKDEKSVYRRAPAIFADCPRWPTGLDRRPAKLITVWRARRPSTAVNAALVAVRSGSISTETPAAHRPPCLCQTKTTLGVAEPSFGGGSAWGRAAAAAAAHERQTVADLGWRRQRQRRRRKDVSSALCKSYLRDKRPVRRALPIARSSSSM